MAKIRVVNEASWYHELKLVNTYTETKYENMIFHHAQALFPDFIAIQYKKEVNDALNGNKKPDIALIRNDLKTWWIVEAELAQHGIEEVKKQIDVFVNGNYNTEDIARYVIDQIGKKYPAKRVSSQKIEQLIKKEAPKILVIVDRDKPDWEKEFRRIGVELCVFEIYKNSKARYSYRTYGNYPYVILKESLCNFHKHINNTLVVMDKSVLEGKNGNINIDYDGFSTKWDIIRENGNLFLKFLGKEPPVNSLNDFVLSRSSKSKFFLKRN